MHVRRTIIGALALLAIGAMGTAMPDFTTDFMIEHCDFTPTGRNLYFSLEPGQVRVLEGEDEGTELVVEIAVLANTKRISFRAPNGQRMVANCRVIREREWEDGELIEISRNYFARCKRTGNIFYFGEDVDIYEDGEIVSHDGAWRAGDDGAQPGLIMPSVYLLGARYYQEIAPDVALDRAYHAAMGITLDTPFGEFHDCVKIVETTPLEPGDRSVKIYAPGVGLIYDDGIRLTELNDM